MFGWFKKKAVVELSESELDQKITEELERHSKIIRDNLDKFVFSKRISGIMEFRLIYGKYTYWIDIMRPWNKFELYALTIGKWSRYDFECTRTTVSQKYYQEVEDYFADKCKDLWITQILNTNTERKEKMKRVLGI
jgi:hypothetical protein